jgi:hypothetical protein
VFDVLLCCCTDRAEEEPDAHQQPQRNITGKT